MSNDSKIVWSTRLPVEASYSQLSVSLEIQISLVFMKIQHQVEAKSVETSRNSHCL